MADPTPPGPAAHTGDRALLYRVLGQLSPQAANLLLSLGGYLLYSLSVVLLADLLQYLLDSLNRETVPAGGLIGTLAEQLLSSGSAHSLESARVIVPVAIVFLALFRALGYFGGTYFIHRVARNLIHELRLRLYDALLVAPATYFDKQGQGALLAKITFNVEQVSGAITQALRTLLCETLVIVALLLYMFYLNSSLALIFLLLMPLVALIVSRVARQFRLHSKKIQSSMGEVAQISGDTILAWRELRLLRAQKQQRQRFFQASDYNRRQGLKMAGVEAVSTPAIQVLVAAAIALLVWIALSPSILSDMSPGSLVAFLVAAVQLGKPVRQLSSVQNQVQQGLAAMEDIYTQLDEPSEDSGDGGLSTHVRGDVFFDAVSFSYPGADQAALRNVTLRARAGETVAIVGPSGAGKSTLFQLLAGFYQPQNGTIRIDDTSLAELALSDLRHQLALVSQRPALLRDTIYNNVALGELASRSPQAIEQALKISGVDAFAQAQPSGLNTLIGDDGGKLSGGQRQRIAIARALLKDAPVLMLDEAMSALDNEAEAILAVSLQRLMANRTTLVVAHRLTTVENADRIYVLDAGEVVEEGSHDELLQANGLYARLYAREFSR